MYEYIYHSDKVADDCKARRDALSILVTAQLVVRMMYDLIQNENQKGEKGKRKFVTRKMSFTRRI